MVRILVVDDEDMIRTLLVGLLQEHGHRVDAADSVERAVGFLKDSRGSGPEYELIVTDLDMPKINGLEFMKAARSRHIPMLVFTAVATKEAVVESVRSGASDFMSKGKFNAKDFIAKVNKLLTKSGSQHGGLTSPSHAPSPSAAPAEKAAPKPLIAVEKKLDKIRDIDALSFVASEIIKITSERGSSAKELVNAITKDQCISSKVLRMSNSVFYKTNKRIRNLEDAVINIGFTGIQEMAVAVSVVEQFKEGDKDGLDRIELWKHSIMTSILARKIATLVKYPNPERAFLAGLLHDIGKIMFDGKFHEEYKAVMAEVKGGRGLIEEVERRILGLDHAELAGKVLLSWNFPEAIRDAICFQNHGLDGILNLKGKDHPLIAICIVANTLAEMLHVSHVGFEEYRNLDSHIVPFIDKEGALTPDALSSGLIEEYRDLEGILLMNASSSITWQTPQGIEMPGERLAIVGGHPLASAVLRLRWTSSCEVVIRDKLDLAGCSRALILLQSPDQVPRVLQALKANPQPVKPLVVAPSPPSADDAAYLVPAPCLMSRLDQAMGLPS